MIEATVVRGHGVASGAGGDPRFPAGTLRLQFPLFARHGLDLSGLHPGTINLDLSPASFEILRPKLTLTNIHWHPHCPPETFSFFDCRLGQPGVETDIAALIYYPHPETKPEHFQASTVLEILAPKLEGLTYGQKLGIEPDPSQLRIRA